MRALCPLLLCAATGCAFDSPVALAPADGEVTDGPESDGGSVTSSAADAAPADTGFAVVDVGAQDAGPAATDWRVVAERLDAAVADGRLVGFSFAVFVDGAEPAFIRAGGAYGPLQPLPLDSCSKPITALTVLRLVDAGTIALTDTLSDRLGWSGDEGTVTLAQLMAFTSGFPGNAPCLSPAATLRPDGTLWVRPNRSTLAECAQDIRGLGLISTPGTALHYGGTHQNILAHVVEQATARSWDEVFETEVRQPLGLGEQVAYRSNRVAGSAAGLAPAVARIFQQIGADAGYLPATEPRLLSAPLAQRFLTDQTPDPVDRTDSPWARVGQDLRFGLGIWIDCAGDDCLYIGSGANGSTAWIDTEGGYAAALLLYQRSLFGYTDGYAMLRDLVVDIRTILR